MSAGKRQFALAIVGHVVRLFDAPVIIADVPFVITHRTEQFDSVRNVPQHGNPHPVLFALIRPAAPLFRNVRNHTIRNKRSERRSASVVARPESVRCPPSRQGNTGAVFTIKPCRITRFQESVILFVITKDANREFILYKRHTHCAGKVAGILLTQGHRQVPHFFLQVRPFGNELDRSSHVASSIQRALRALQDFHSLNITES